MRRIAGDKDAALAEFLGDQRAAYPGQYAQNLVVEIEAGDAADHGADIGFAMGFLVGSADDRQPPLIAAIDRDDGREGPFGADEDMAIGLALVVHLDEIGAAENDVGRIGQNAAAAHADAENVAHAARPAVAADEIARADGLALTALHRFELGADAVRILGKAEKLGAIPYLHMLRHRAAPLQQDGIEHVLRATLAVLRALRRGHLVLHRREAFAPQLVAVERGEIHVVLRIIARIGRMLDRIDQPPAAAELHRPEADEIHARLIDRSVALLDDEAAPAAPTQIARQRQPYRAGADDQNRHSVRRIRHRLTSSTAAASLDRRDGFVAVSAFRSNRGARS